MRLAAYIMLLLAFSIVFYLLGYQSPLVTLLGNQNPACTADKIAAAEAAGISLNCAMDPQAFLKVIAGNITSDQGLQSLLLIAIAGFAVSLLTGFGAMYIMPLLMLLAFLNYVVFPISFIADPLLPAYVKYPLFAFFNIIGILAYVSFIRGGT